MGSFAAKLTSTHTRGCDSARCPSRRTLTMYGEPQSSRPALPRPAADGPPLPLSPVRFPGPKQGQPLSVEEIVAEGPGWCVLLSRFRSIKETRMPFLASPCCLKNGRRSPCPCWPQKCTTTRSGRSSIRFSLHRRTVGRASTSLTMRWSSAGVSFRKPADARSKIGCPAFANAQVAGSSTATK